MDYKFKRNFVLSLVATVALIYVYNAADTDTSAPALTIQQAQPVVTEDTLKTFKTTDANFSVMIAAIQDVMSVETNEGSIKVDLVTKDNKTIMGEYTNYGSFKRIVFYVIEGDGFDVRVDTLGLIDYQNDSKEIQLDNVVFFNEHVSTVSGWLINMHTNLIVDAKSREKSHDINDILNEG